MKYRAGIAGVVPEFREAMLFAVAITDFVDARAIKMFALGHTGVGLLRVGQIPQAISSPLQGILRGGHA